MDSLVPDGNRKQFISALVTHHGFNINDSSFDDFVRDKGKGLVGLLAGFPSVGTSFAAEAVAEIAHNRLHVFSLGELGN